MDINCTRKKKSREKKIGHCIFRTAKTIRKRFPFNDFHIPCNNFGTVLNCKRMCDMQVLPAIHFVGLGKIFVSQAENGVLFYGSTSVTVHVFVSQLYAFRTHAPRSRSEMKCKCCNELQFEWCSVSFGAFAKRAFSLAALDWNCMQLVKFLYMYLFDIENCTQPL